MGHLATVFHHGDRADDLVIERVQDCTAIAEAATAARNEGRHGDSEMRHAMSLPNVMVERYCNDKGITFAQWMADPAHQRAMLNDPALAAFRVWPGRV